MSSARALSLLTALRWTRSDACCPRVHHRRSSPDAGRIGLAAVRRLARIVSAGQEPIEELGTVGRRERLYDILSRFPSADALPVLEQIRAMYPAMDGDAERPIGAALAEALERCRGIEAQSLACIGLANLTLAAPDAHEAARR